MITYILSPACNKYNFYDLWDLTNCVFMYSDTPANERPC